MRRVAITAGVVGLIVAMALAEAASAAAMAPTGRTEANALRERVSPALCVVTVENAWGIPQSVSTGFLLGNGRFVVCDLGAVKHRGVQRVTLRFPDGKTVQITDFGMADPALGLAALRVGEGEPDRAGLPLAAAMPVLDTGQVVSSAGWRWGHEIAVTCGRALRGPKIEEVASRSQVETPPGIEGFIRVDGGRIDAASGGPVLDADGNVLAVRLDVDAKKMTLALAMPATTLRKSFLSAQPELRPLADLPEPLWPVQILRLPGEPTDEKTLGRASLAIQRLLICSTCRGKGKVSVGRFGFGAEIPCPACLGAGLRIDADSYDKLSEWAIQGTRVAWAPGVPAARRTVARKLGVEMMTQLGKVGQQIRRLMGPLGSMDLVPLKESAMPSGVILYARVSDQVEGPDGQYLILEAVNTRARIAVRVEDMLGHDGLGPQPGRQVPKPATRFAMAGTVLSTFKSEEQQGIYVLPFEWTTYVPALEEQRDRRPPPPPGDRGGPPDRGGQPPDRGGPGRGWPGPGR
ncbi:MAG: hypothetical protein IMZ66_04920, partial [Planctomycetes bacterium]|nr:hypothetical protein [Planctomycetota bacterium]